MLVERGEGAGHVVAVGGRAHPGRDVGHAPAQVVHRRLVLGVDQLDRVAGRAERGHHGVTVAVAQRLGQRADLLAVAMRRAQGEHRGVVATTQSLDQVGEHGSRLHRGELVGVTDEHQPRVGADRLEQPRHHRQRDHRGLVDHDHVVREPDGVGGAGSGRCCRVATQQPVQGRRLQAGHPCPVGVGGELGGRLVHGLLQAGRGLARRRAQRDPRALAGRGLVLLGDQRQQARDRRRLAGARAAGEDRRPLPGRGAYGGPLLVVAARRGTPARARPRAGRCRPPGPAGAGGAPGRRRPGPPPASSGRGRGCCPRAGAPARGGAGCRPPLPARRWARATAASPVPAPRPPQGSRRGRGRRSSTGRRRPSRAGRRGRRAPRPGAPSRATPRGWRRTGRRRGRRPR